MLCDAPSASITFASAVNGGTITTSISVMSPRSSRSDSTKRADSACVMFIVQLAATIFLRINLFVRKGGNAGQLFTFEQLERGATAGGNESHLVGQPGLLYRCDRVAAADNCRRSRFRQRFRDRSCPFGKIGNFKNADRPIPQNCLRFRDLFFKQRN